MEKRTQTSDESVCMAVLNLSHLSNKTKYTLSRGIIRREWIRINMDANQCPNVRRGIPVLRTVFYNLIWQRKHFEECIIMPRFYAFMTINNNPTRFHYKCTHRKQWTKTMEKKKNSRWRKQKQNTKHGNQADKDDINIIENDKAVNTIQLINS